MTFVEPVHMIGVSEMYAGGLAPLGPRSEPSGIVKTAVPPPWIITETGLERDAQGDRVHHGGPEKAIHQYPREHYAAWLREFPTLGDVLARPPAFGENLAICGMIEQNVHIGDVYQVGSAQLQVSQGRQPCWKLNVHLGRRDIAYKMQTSGRTGWYYRVLETGRAEPGDPFILIDRPRPDWPLSKLIALIFSRTIDIAELERALMITELSPSWRTLLHRRKQTRSIEDWRKRLNSPEP
jgi:MOSC domain-containing protein YiiM